MCHLIRGDPNNDYLLTECAEKHAYTNVGMAAVRCMLNVMVKNLLNNVNCYHKKTVSNRKVTKLTSDSDR